MLSQQIKNELPADLLLNIMQYACYKTHDNAKMIKELMKNLGTHSHKNGAGRLISAFVTLEQGYGGGEGDGDGDEYAVEYIERECAEMFKEVDIHDEYMIGGAGVVDWFELLTEQYADCSDEFRDNLIIYSEMIREVQNLSFEYRWEGQCPWFCSRTKPRERAWGLYKIISDCPTSVY